MMLLLVQFAHAAAPVAEAGEGLLARVDDTVELNGSGSTDPEGDELSYAWIQVGGPEVELTGADRALPRFKVPAPGVYTFDLVVSDTFESSAPDSTKVVVPWEGVPGSEASGCASAQGNATLALPAALLAAAALARRRQGERA
jgi:uncharacterized protein (TIGR03382 family)